MVPWEYGGNDMLPMTWNSDHVMKPFAWPCSLDTGMDYNAYVEI